MTKGKRIFKSITYSLVLSLALSSVAMAAPSDLKGHWAEKQINEWVTKDFLTGYKDGTVRPDNKITRAEFATLVNKSFNFTKTSSVGFKDVKTGDWYYNEIAKAVAAGYISGYKDGTARPNNMITRQEAAVILAKLAKLDTSKSSDSILATVPDAAEIYSWSKDSVGAIVEKGIMNGYKDKTFRPKRAITRAESIVTLDKVINSITKTEVTFDKAGEYGPASGTETIEGDVVISVEGVTLQNTIIKGNLVLAKGINEGDVSLKNVKVNGTTTVQGGGAHSVHFIDSTLSTVLVDKENGAVRLIAKGSTAINDVQLHTGATLEEDQLSSGTGFNGVTIASTLPSSATASFIGDFGSVNVGASNIAVNVTGGTISELTVPTNVTGVTINVPVGAGITTMTLNSAATVTGTGSIGTANINVTGSKFEKSPTNVNKPDNVQVEIGTNPPGGSGGNGGPTASTILTDPSLTVWTSNDDEDYVDGTTTYPAGSILQYNVNFKSGVTLGQFSSAAVDFYVGTELVGTNTVKAAALATYANSPGLTGLITAGPNQAEPNLDPFWNIGQYTSNQKPTKAIFRLVKDGVEHTVTANFTPSNIQIPGLLTSPSLAVWTSNDDEEYVAGTTTYAAGSILQYNVNFKSGVTLGQFSSAAVDFYVGNQLVGTNTVKAAALATYKDSPGLTGLITAGPNAAEPNLDPFWNIGEYTSSEKPTKAVFRLVKDGVEYTAEASMN